MADLHQPTVNPRAAVPFERLDVVLHRVAGRSPADTLDCREHQLFADAPVPLVSNLHVRDDVNPDAIIKHLPPVHLLLAKGIEPQVKVCIMGEHEAQVGERVVGRALGAVLLRGLAHQLYQAGRARGLVAIPIGGSSRGRVVPHPTVCFSVKEARPNRGATVGADDLQPLTRGEGVSTLLPGTPVAQALRSEVAVNASSLPRPTASRHGTRGGLALRVGTELPLLDPLSAQPADDVGGKQGVGGRQDLNRLDAPGTLGVVAPGRTGEPCPYVMSPVESLVIGRQGRVKALRYLGCLRVAGINYSGVQLLQ